MAQANHNIQRRSNWRRKLSFLLLSLLVFVVVGEVAARAFWKIQYDVPLLNPSQILYIYYPELKRVDAIKPNHSDDTYDILLLGGSVLHWVLGTVERELLEQLAYEGHRNVRIFNLSKPAQTSRDSWLKYLAVGDARFDLVIFYHGINETRANNVPPELFRQDYSHYSWYELVNELAPYHKVSSLALPYSLRFLVTRVRQRMNKNLYVPVHGPRSEWTHYGETYRSATSFDRNLRAILDLSLLRGDQMLLMTFATYVPRDYSLKAFREKRLDYVLHNHNTPIEIWGEPGNVIGAVAAHNDIIKQVAREHTDVLFVDQAILMKDSARYFNDSCHFTTVGSSKFVENLLEVLLPTLKKE